MDELPSVLWAYRTTPRKAIGKTLFLLAFGMESVVLVEIGAWSERVLNYREAENEMAAREELDLLEEVCDRASIENYADKQSMAKYHNQRARPRRFQVGDLVLRRVEFTRQPHYTKLSAHWEGPYIVQKEVYPGTYKLKREDGTELPRFWNTEHLKKFYQ